MKEFPKNVVAYSKTATFTQSTIPKGLLNSHTTKAGTWGKICILSGTLKYVIEDRDPLFEITLSDVRFGVVEPESKHHVEPIGKVEFYVEFYK